MGLADGGWLPATESDSAGATPRDVPAFIYWESTDTGVGSVGNTLENQQMTQRIFLVPAGFFPDEDVTCANATNHWPNTPLWRRFLIDLLGYTVPCNLGSDDAPKWSLSRVPPDFHPYMGSAQYPWVAVSATYEPIPQGPQPGLQQAVTQEVFNTTPCVSSVTQATAFPVQRLMKITATYMPVDYWPACDGVNGFSFGCPGSEIFRYTTWTNQANAQLLQVGQGAFKYCTNANKRGCAGDLVVPWNPSTLVGTNTINILWHQVPQNPNQPAVAQYIPPNNDFLQASLGCLNLYNWPDPDTGPWPAGTLVFNNYSTAKVYPPRWSLPVCGGSTPTTYGDLYFDINFELVLRNAGPVPQDYPYYQCPFSGSSASYTYTLDQAMGWNWFYRPEVVRYGECIASRTKIGDFDLATGGYDNKANQSFAGDLNGSKLYNRYIDFNLLFTIDPQDWLVTSGTDYGAGCTAPGVSTNLGGLFAGAVFSSLSAGTLPTCCVFPNSDCSSIAPSCL